MRFVFIFLLFCVPSILFAQEFTSLTGIRAIEGATTADGFTELLNYIYRLAIGAAAIIAVFQIIRSGFEYLNFESVTDKKNARNRILMAFGGLLLALSPVIVFSIIDQRIYSLELNAEPLQVQTGQVGLLGTEQTDPCRYITVGGTYEHNAEHESCCRQKGGHPRQTRGGNLWCANEPAPDAGQPGDVGLNNDGSAYINVPAPFNHFGILQISKNLSAECLTVRYASFPEESECTARASELGLQLGAGSINAPGDWFTFYACFRELSPSNFRVIPNTFRNPTTNQVVPFCRSIQPL